MLRADERTGRTMAFSENGDDRMPRKTNTDAATDMFAAFTRSFTDVQDRFGLKDTGREAVMNGLATARERTAAARETLLQAGASAETFAGAMGAAYANLARDMVEAGFANAEMFFDTAEKMAAAASPAEAMKAQSDYLQVAATANAERARKAAETAQETLTANAEKLRAGFEKMNPLGNMAA
jgi:hypothetical protein